MEFTKLTNEVFGARKLGYRFDLDAEFGRNESLLRDVTAYCGERFADDLIDGFFDLDGDLYKGEDGEYYAVQMYLGKPLVWQRLINHVEFLRRHREVIEEEMVEKYSSVLDSRGRCQYKLYMWDDGEPECLCDAQGSSGYLVPKRGESRSLYYITTIAEPCFDPWDYTDHSAPDDEEEREKEREEICSWLVDEYRAGVHDLLDEILDQMEKRRSMEAEYWNWEWGCRNA